MIRFTLACDDGHEFEGWFRNAGDFDTQADAGHVSCPMCGGTDVRKALMAPNVSTSRSKVARGDVVEASPQSDENSGAQPNDAAATEGGEAVPTIAVNDPRQAEFVEVLRKLRDTVVQNTENVGKGFAEEARKMHYGEAKKRGIHGETNPQEAHELREEGIDILPLPGLPEDKN